MKVLNVEDNPIKHCHIKRALEYCGAKTVDCCNNLQEGLEALKEAITTEKKYDLLVTDMRVQNIIFPYSRTKVLLLSTLLNLTPA